MRYEIKWLYIYSNSCFFYFTLPWLGSLQLYLGLMWNAPGNPSIQLCWLSATCLVRCAAVGEAS